MGQGQYAGLAGAGCGVYGAIPDCRIATSPSIEGLSYHFCQRINLSRSLSSASALCFITAGALSGLPPIRISATGGTIRSLGGIGQSEGCVIDVEQPTISHAIAHGHIFDFVTVDYLTFDNYLCAFLCCLFLAGG